MTTSSDILHGAPRLPPPQPGTVSPEAIAMALADPTLTAQAQMPYLPPAAPPRPAVSSPPVFDARALVDATKRKVENPAYGQLPTGTAESRAAADAARAHMRRKRQRNKILGWVMAITFVAVVAGVGYALYAMYQHDQDEPHAHVSPDSLSDALR